MKIYTVYDVYNEEVIGSFENANAAFNEARQLCVEMADEDDSIECIHDCFIGIDDYGTEMVYTKVVANTLTLKKNWGVA